MKRIIVVSYNDKDISEGLTELLEEHPKTPILIPVTENQTFVKSAVMTAMVNGCPFQLYFSQADEFMDSLMVKAEDLTVCDNPIKEILREVTPEDIFAISWDNSVEAHMALHAVEDFGVETWDISDGLDQIEVGVSDSTELFNEMQEALSVFIESFSAFIAAGVLETLTKTLDAVILEQLGTTKYNPFDKE